jgi:16S rRNA G966 N2-methylase RsmD
VARQIVSSDAYRDKEMSVSLSVFFIDPPFHPQLLKIDCPWIQGINFQYQKST